MRPAPPNEELLARVAGEGAEHDSHAGKIDGSMIHRTAAPLHRWWLAPMGAAAVIALVLWLADPRPHTSVAPNETPPLQLPSDGGGPQGGDLPSYRPAVADSVLYHARQEGIVFAADATPYRRTRYQFVDSYRWTNPQDGSSIQINVPRDEILQISLEPY